MIHIVRSSPGVGVYTDKMGMFVPPYMLKRRGLTELIKLKKWVLSELKER